MNHDTQFTIFRSLPNPNLCPLARRRPMQLRQATCVIANYYTAKDYNCAKRIKNEKAIYATIFVAIKIPIATIRNRSAMITNDLFRKKRERAIKGLDE